MLSPDAAVFLPELLRTWHTLPLFAGGLLLVLILCAAVVPWRTATRRSIVAMALSAGTVALLAAALFILPALAVPARTWIALLLLVYTTGVLAVVLGLQSLRSRVPMRHARAAVIGLFGIIPALAAAGIMLIESGIGDEPVAPAPAPARIAETPAPAPANAAAPAAPTAPAGRSFVDWLSALRKPAPSLSSHSSDLLNFRFTPPDGWAPTPARPIAGGSCFSYMRDNPRQLLVLIAETTSQPLARGQETLVETVLNQLHQSNRQLTAGEHLSMTLGGQPATRVLVYDEVLGEKLVHVYSMLYHRGFAYQIILTGPARTERQLSDDADRICARFSLIDPFRSTIATPGRMEAFTSRFGYRVNLPQPGWHNLTATMTDKVNAEFVATLGDEVGLKITPVSLQGHTADLHTLAKAIARSEQIEFGEATDFSETTELGANCLAFAARSSVSSVPFRCRVVHRGDVLILFAAWIARPGTTVHLRSVLAGISLQPDGPRSMPTSLLTARDRKASAIVLNELALGRMADGQASPSIPLLETARRLSPDDLQILLNLIDAHSLSGQPRPGLLIIDREMDHFHSPPALLVRRAQLLAEAGEIDRAAGAYAGLFRSGYRNDNDFSAYLRLLTGNKRLDEAISAAEDYVQRSGSMNATLNLAELYVERGNPDRALTLLKTRQQGIAFNSTLALVTADIHERTGQYALALEDARGLLRHGNDSSATYNLMGRAQAGLKHYREAKEAFETALRKSPGDPVATEWIKLLSRQLGEGDNAAIKQEIAAVPVAGPLVAVPDAARIAELCDGHSAAYLVRLTALEFEPEKTLTTTEYRVIRVVDAHGVEAFSTLQISFDPMTERLCVNRLIVRDEAGKIVAQGRAADYYVMDENGDSATSRRTLNVPVPGLRPGCTIDAVYTRSDLAPPATFRFFSATFTTPYPTDRISLLIRSDRSRIAWHGTVQAQPVDSDGALCWTLRSPPVFRMEPLMPRLETVIPWLQVGSRSATWDGEARDYLHTIEDRLKPDADARALAERLTQGITDPQARIAALLNHLQKQYTYRAIAFGPRARVPQPPADIIRNRYGDCKDHSLLLQQMLGSLGIPAHLALVLSAGPFSPDLPSIDQFDHMIVYIPSTGAFYGCTDKGDDLTCGVPAFLSGRTALVLDPAKPRLVTIGPYPREIAPIRIERTARIEKDADFVVAESIRIPGYEAGQLRNRLRYVQPPDRPQFMEQILSSAQPVQVHDLKITGLDNPSEPLVIDLHYTVRRALRSVNGQLIGSLPAPMAHYWFSPTTVEKRVNPFFLEFPATLQSTITLQLPQGLEVAGKLQDSSLDLPHTHARVTHASEGRSLITTCVIRNGPGLYPAGEYAAFCRAREELLAGLEPAIAFRRQP